VRLGKYLKAAFLNRWNLLAFLGGLGFALLSGPADVALPLVLAGEIAFLGLLGTHPKFQKYVDAQQAKLKRAESSLAREHVLRNIMRALPKDLLERFESLRTRCSELRQIALELKRPGMVGSEMLLEESQLAGLDRLLWIYLRLLYTQFALSRFLEKTSEDRIQRDVERLQQRIEQLPADADSPRWQRIRKALEGNLEASRSRLANLNKARDNYQLVELEIDRLENKIRSLSEMAVNRQEPEAISSQVDDVASSMLETERTMNELQFATGLDPLDDEAPELLRSKTI
jgi:chemotaxis protein histidine kinase CheA